LNNVNADRLLSHRDSSRTRLAPYWVTVRAMVWLLTN